VVDGAAARQLVADEADDPLGAKEGGGSVGVARDAVAFEGEGGLGRRSVSRRV
jgi:hypothetical protein